MSCKIRYNKEKEIISVFIRGTTGVKEWTSNFDIGESDYQRFIDERLDVDNHLGFDVAVYRIHKELEEYISCNNLKSCDRAYFVTGHSRGAAIANLIAKDLVDNVQNNNDKVFGYTFAAPNNTTSVNHDDEKYDSIFNIINSDDLVPYLPLGEPYDSNSAEYNNWGFTKYGIIKPYSIKDNCEAEWERTSKLFDYNSNGNLYDTLIEFGKIVEPSGILSRNELYKFTGEDDECISCYKNDSKVTELKLFSNDDQETIENFRKWIGEERMSPYCEITVDHKSATLFEPASKVIIRQCPAFLMMDLVYITVKEERGGKIHGIFGYDVASKYEDAKRNFIHSGIDSMFHDTGFGGMRDPHLPFSYYMISNNLN